MNWSLIEEAACTLAQAIARIQNEPRMQLVEELRYRTQRLDELLIPNVLAQLAAVYPAPLADPEFSGGSYCDAACQLGLRFWNSLRLWVDPTAPATYSHVADRDLNLAWPECLQAIAPEPRVDVRRLTRGIQAELRVVADRIVQSQISSSQAIGADLDACAEKNRLVSVDALATACLIDNPGWNHEQIAVAIRCHIKSLTKIRCPDYHATRERIRQQVRLIRGKKSADGSVEAYIDE